MSVNPASLKGLPSMAAYKRFDNSQDLRDFLSNVFQQVEVEGFMKVYGEAVRKVTPEEAYQHMLENARTVQGGVFRRTMDGLNALKGERGTLAENVGKIMDPLRPKDGYVEITLAGRMIKAIAPLIGMTGRITVINEQKKPRRTNRSRFSCSVP